MNKNRFLKHKLLDKSNIALTCLLGMVAGFLMSRSVLSIAMVVFGANALRDINPRRWFAHKWWLIGLLWVAMYAISYFWSDNTVFWNERFQVKLPILLLPLSFSFLPSFSVKQLRIFTIVTALLMLGGVFYSVSHLINHVTFYVKEYTVSHVLPSPVGDDHIRFSLSIVLFIIWCIYIWPKLGSRILKIFIAISVILLSIYLHILAAKSGLIVWYLFVIAWGIYLLFIKKNNAGLGIIVILILFLYSAFKFIPTFNQRIGYMHYTYDMYEQGDITGNYGDIGRVMSYKVAFKIIKQHPLAGVGAGDILDEMKKGYRQRYPLVKNENILLPHNQFLTVAVACGIPTAIVFCIWVFIPLLWLRKNRESFFFFIVWLGLLVQLMVEPVLEVQYGVFVYLFFLLWQRQALCRRNDS